MQELKLLSASEIVYKQAGLFDSMKSWFGNNKNTPVSSNFKQLAQQLSQSWRAFAAAYNKQKDIINPAYQNLTKILSVLSKSEHINLMQPPPDVAAKINDLIQKLNQATAEESQDMQFMGTIAQTLNGLSEYFNSQANTTAPNPAEAENQPQTPANSPRPIKTPVNPAPYQIPSGTALGTGYASKKHDIQKDRGNRFVDEMDKEIEKAIEDARYEARNDARDASDEAAWNAAFEASRFRRQAPKTR